MEPLLRTFLTKDGRKLTVDLMQTEDLTEVCKFLNHHFFETLPNRYLVKNHPANQVAMSEFIHQCIQDSNSLIIRDSNGKLVAVRLNSLDEPNKHKTPNLPNNELIADILTSLEKDIDLFTIYKTNKILSLQLMAVDKDYSGLGLGTMLVKMSLELAEKLGAGAVGVCAVSEAAATVAAKNGLETLRTIDYATFELNGAKPLANEAKLLAEHRVAKFMARSIP